MVDIDNVPDPYRLWTRILAGVFSRKSRVEETSESSFDRDFDVIDNIRAEGRDDEDHDA